MLRCLRLQWCCSESDQLHGGRSPWVQWLDDNLIFYQQHILLLLCSCFLHLCQCCTQLPLSSLTSTEVNESDRCSQYGGNPVFSSSSLQPCSFGGKYVPAATGSLPYTSEMSFFLFCLDNIFCWFEPCIISKMWCVLLWCRRYQFGHLG